MYYEHNLRPGKKNCSCGSTDDRGRGEPPNPPVRPGTRVEYRNDRGSVTNVYFGKQNVPNGRPFSVLSAGETGMGPKRFVRGGQQIRVSGVLRKKSRHIRTFTTSNRSGRTLRRIAVR